MPMAEANGVAINYELDAMIEDRAIGEQAEQMFLEDLEDSREIVLSGTWRVREASNKTDRPAVSGPPPSDVADRRPAAGERPSARGRRPAATGQRTSARSR
jgi:hypothetical protein